MEVREVVQIAEFYELTGISRYYFTCEVELAFKARLDKFWQHQSMKFDFTADLTGTGNRESH